MMGDYNELTRQHHMEAERQRQRAEVAERERASFVVGERTWRERALAAESKLKEAVGLLTELRDQAEESIREVSIAQGSFSARYLRDKAEAFLARVREGM